jgi:hypothetical protein
MRTKYQAIGRVVVNVIVALIAFFSGLWGAMALWFQLPGGAAVRALGSALWAILIVCLFAWTISRRNWLPLMVYALAFVALMVWWSTIAPSNHRVWADDVAQLMSGTVDGSKVTLSNVRNFTWRTEDDHDIRWETRSYDLDHIASADAVLSYWGSKEIAHAMMSFGFDDGRHVVFSVEIRKKRGQQYSAIGGFFKRFDMILTAADERDIIAVRTNVRDEDDYLFPLTMSKPAMRELFLSYVDAANQLVATPAFYNTLTSNCTTIVYRMAKRLDPGLPYDVRLLITGYLPEYLYEIGALDQRVSVKELRRRGRITDRARASPPGDDISKAIRAGLNGP